MDELREAVFSIWRDKPLPPGQLAEYFLNERKKAGLKLPNANAVNRAVQYAKRKVRIDRPTYRKKLVERYGLSEMKRGALVHIDSAFISHGLGAKYVLVAVCSFSHGIYLEAMKQLNGRNAALALSRIVVRFPEGPIEAVFSDRG